MKPARLLALALAVAAGPFAAAQPPAAQLKPEEYYSTFREYFAAGRYDLAAEYLKGYVATNPSDADLLAIEAKYGTGTFRALQGVPKWSDDPKADAAARETANTLTTRVREATEKLLRDPVRIQKYVTNLGASYEEQVFAEAELRRTGDYAVPFVVDAFRKNPDPNFQSAVLGTITRADPPSLAAWVGAWDGLTPDQRYAVLTSLLSRPDALTLPAVVETDYRPHLWYYAGGPADEAPTLRKLALDTLSRLYAGPAERRQPSDELVRIARTFYDRKARFASAKSNADGSPTTATLWTWEPAGEKLVKTENVPVGRAEEYYGLRYTRWALDRKPDDLAAQRLGLALATERAVERGKFGELSRTSPAAYQLLADAPAGLLTELLAEALDGKRTALALGLTQAIGDRGDKVPTVAGKSGDRPGLLVRALDYPDARLQFAAANALLRSGQTLPPEVRRKVLDTMRRAAAVDPGTPGDVKGQALIADPNKLRSDALAAILRGVGYQVEQYGTGRDVFRRVARSSDFDVVFVDRHVGGPELRDVLSHLSADTKAQGRPVVVVASADAPRLATLDGLLVRLAVLVVVTETDTPDVPTAFAPDIRRAPEENDRLRRQTQTQRDDTLRRLNRSRAERLQRVLDSSGMTFTPAQRELLALRVEQVTWAAIAAEYPVSREAAPETAAYLELFNRRVAAQPPIPTYSRVPSDILLARVERLQTDVDANPAVKKRYDAIRQAVDPASFGLDPGPSRDPAAEAVVARIVRDYPTAAVIREPYSRVGFEDDLRAAFADPAQAPRDPAEKRAAARVAVDWLRAMAVGEVVGYDAKTAESELRAALRADDLAPSAIDAVSRFSSAEAQGDLIGVAVAAGRPAPLRVKAADAAVKHVQVFGKLAAKTTTDALTTAAAEEKNADVRAKLVVLKGLLLGGDNFLSGLRQYTPPVADMPTDKGATPPADPAPAPPPNN